MYHLLPMKFTYFELGTKFLASVLVPHFSKNIRHGRCYLNYSQLLRPPSLLYNGYRVLFPVVKRPGLGVDHSPPSGAEFKERVEL